MFRFIKDAKAAYDKSKAFHQELREEFNATVGRNFMHLPPLLHDTLCHEARQFGIKTTVQTFLTILTTISEQDNLTDDEKHSMLIDTYKSRKQSLRQNK